MWAIPAWKYVLLDAATAPEVDGPMTSTTFGSATNFCAAAWAGAGPCSTGVSNTERLIFRPIAGASCLTASFAQESCSVPRKPAPPVTGDTKPSFSGDEQLIALLFPAEAVLFGRAEAAATTASASAAAAKGRINLSLRNLCILLAVGETGDGNPVEGETPTPCSCLATAGAL